MANNGPLAKQAAQLQSMANTYIAQQQQHSPVVQRKIDVRTGEHYAESTALPEQLQDSPLLQRLANSTETALAQSVTDLSRCANGEAAPILTPRRHLIGENHDDSHFDEAVAAWGWGAAKMQEGFQTSKTVQDLYTQSWLNPGFFGSKAKVGTLPLEDVHARMLQDIAMYRKRISNLGEGAEILSTKVGLNKLTAQDKTNYNTFRTVAEHGKGNLLMRLKGYETACTALLVQDKKADTPAQTALRYMANRMDGQWDTLRQQMKSVVSSPWNLIMPDSGDLGVANKLTQRSQAVKALRGRLDKLASLTIEVLKAENNNNQGASNAADLAYGDVVKGGNPLTAVSPLREVFMRQKINAMPKPGLVGTGYEHVKNLNGQITDGEYHDSYDDFCNAIQTKAIAPIEQAEIPGKEDNLQMKFNKGTVQRMVYGKNYLQKKSTDSQPASGNRTGMPDQLKTGLEQLSGLDLSSVRVHYNSPKLAQMNAMAYAQGRDIHVGSVRSNTYTTKDGMWSKQMQGRVKPTTQLKGKINVNDDAGLEKEADLRGAKALQMMESDQVSKISTSQMSTGHQQQKQTSSPVQMLTHAENQNATIGNISVSQLVIQAKLRSDVLNVAGEIHSDYDPPHEQLRDKEQTLAKKSAGGEYWTESDFKVTKKSRLYGKQEGESGDPVLYQFLQTVELVNSIGGNHISNMNPQQQDEAKMLRDLVENVARVIGGGVQARYTALEDEFKNEYVKLTDEQADAAAKLGPKLKEMTSKCFQIYDGIESDGSLKKGSKEIGDFQIKCNQLNDEIKHLSALLNKRTAITQENIRVPRSKEMHFSAQASYKTKGVWKIGNNHYNDIANYIKGIFVKSPKYNLLSKAEFNDERDKFDPNETSAGRVPIILDRIISEVHGKKLPDKPINKDVIEKAITESLGALEVLFRSPMYPLEKWEPDAWSLFLDWNTGTGQYRENLPVNKK